MPLGETGASCNRALENKYITHLCPKDAIDPYRQDHSLQDSLQMWKSLSWENRKVYA